MSRHPASIVITASADPLPVQAVLASLRGSLGARDQVVVVGPRQAIRRATGRLVETAPGAPLAQVRNAALAAARHDVIVLVDADTLAPPHAIDSLVEALSDPTVIAAVPVCDQSFGRAQVAAPLAAVASPRAMRAHARSWRDEHRGERWDEPQVGDAVIVARRSTLQAAGLEPGLGRRLGAVGRIRVVGDLFWHHLDVDACVLIDGERPLLSATYIVKDEEELLAESIRSVRDVVDEVVVYDTGSSDRTVEIALGEGARVVEGYWNDHFGDARNRSLNHCRGRWIFGIDADETLEVDAAAMRRLVTGFEGDLVAIEVESPTGAGFGTSEIGRGGRLGRREVLWWSGRLHEQLVGRDGDRPRATILTDLARLRHTGYLAERVAERGKLDRNLQLTSMNRGDNDDGLGGGEAAMNYVRSLMLAGRYEECLSEAAKASAGGSNSPFTVQLLCKAAVVSALALRRPDEAQQWVERIRRVPADGPLADCFDGQIAVQREQWSLAADLFSRVPYGSRDSCGWGLDRASVLADEATALVQCGRADEAADLVVATVTRGIVQLPLPRLATVFRAASGRCVAELGSVPDPATRRVLAGQARFLPDTEALALLEALYGSAPSALDPLVAVCQLAPRLGIEDLLPWAERLRARGLTEHCPLLQRASDAAVPVSERVVAAAVVLDRFADPAAEPLFLELAADVPEPDVAAVTDRLHGLAPGVATRYLVAA